MFRNRRFLSLSAVLAVSTAFLLGKQTGMLASSTLAPANLTRALPSCGKCHAAKPNAFGATKVSVVAARSGHAGTAIPVTVSVAGGPTATAGGFSLTSSKAGLVAGIGMTTNATGTEITHANSSARSWSFAFKPTATGLVEWTLVGMAANADARQFGDSWAFYGPSSAVPGTAFRLFVDGTNVTSYGKGCAGTGGAVPLAGIAANPAVGGSFTIEMYGVRPGSLALAFMGVSSTSWNGITLPFSFATVGAPGCFMLASNEFAVPTLSTGATAGNGVAKWPLTIPATNLFMKGATGYVQTLVFDPGANALGLAMSNALKVLIL